MKPWLSSLAALAFALPLRAGEATHPLLRDFIGLNGQFEFKPDLYRLESPLYLWFTLQ